MSLSGPVHSRVLAARAVAGVLGGRSLDDALHPQADGFTRALSFGVLRHLTRLEALLAPLTARPLKSGSELHALVLCGLYQLLEMDVAEHAAINETVNACEALGQGGARGLVNALLRRVQRERTELVAALPPDPRVQFSYPDWMLSAIARDWGAVTERLLAAGNEQGPMTLRVNRRRGSRETYLQRLQQAGIPGQALDDVADAIRLDTPVAVEKLPGFAAGEVSVQDASAQLAVDLLDLADGQRVLDACSAPGGKSAHILERARVQLTALDNNPGRLSRVKQTLERLGLEAQLALSDAAHVKRWWDGQAFDRILIDAPCSGTGVIRRHPDIKWLRRANDLPPLALTQRRLLDRLWPLLAPGGVLVYATCSILNAEGDELLRGFLQRTPDARLSAMHLPVGLASRCGIRIAPGGDFDGFYYARLTRSSGAASAGVR